MKRIALLGYYGFGNAGDEALLEATLMHLRQAGPDIELTVLSNDPEATARAHRVRSVHRLRPEGLAAIVRSDLVLLGGGGLFQDVTSFRSLAYYTGLMGLAQAAGRKTMAYANSFGPIRTAWGKRLARWIINRADFVTVRDTPSVQELLDAGVTRPPIEVTADPAVLLPPSSRAAGEAFLTRLGVPAAERRLAVFVRPWQGGQRFLPAIAAAVDQLCRRHGVQPVLATVQASQDVPVARALAALLEAPAAVIEEPCRPRDLLDLLATCDFVLGMRLHSLILAGVAGVPSLGLAYDPKVTGFLELAGQPSAGDVTELRPERLAEQLEDAWNRREQLAAALAERWPRLKREAMRNIELVLGLLYRL